jgi:hypothetical protein
MIALALVQAEKVAEPPKLAMLKMLPTGWAVTSTIKGD